MRGVGEICNVDFAEARASRMIKLILHREDSRVLYAEMVVFGMCMSVEDGGKSVSVS